MAQRIAASTAACKSDKTQDFHQSSLAPSALRHNAAPRVSLRRAEPIMVS